MYIIDNYPGECLFWDGTHPLMDQYNKHWTKLVPVTGPAPSFEGECLRMVSRLGYDIFNNGLCNDMLEEIEFLLVNSKFFLQYLVEEKRVAVVSFLRKLKNSVKIRNETEEEMKYRWDDDDEVGGWPMVDMDQNHCDALDWLIESIVLMINEQKK